LSELDLEIKTAMVNYLKEIPEKNERQLKQEEQKEKLLSSIQDCKERKGLVQKEIDQLKGVRDELKAKCTHMRK